jgi:hypothetical protein
MASFRPRGSELEVRRGLSQAGPETFRGWKSMLRCPAIEHLARLFRAVAEPVLRWDRLEAYPTLGALFFLRKATQRKATPTMNMKSERN